MTEVWVIGEEGKKGRGKGKEEGREEERKEGRMDGKEKGRERERKRERGRKDGWEEIFSVGMEGSPDVFRIFAMIWHMMD